VLGNYRKNSYNGGEYPGVSLKTLDLLIYRWPSLVKCRFHTRVWNLLSFSIAWSVWLMRNDIVFNIVHPNWNSKQSLKETERANLAGSPS